MGHDLPIGIAAWVRTEHFAIAVLFPTMAATVCMWASRDAVRGNFWIFFAAVCATIVVALPPVEPWLHVLDPEPANLHTLPLLPVAYLLLGRYRLPNPALAYGATFFSLLIADLVGANAYAQLNGAPAGSSLVGVGGAGARDGLVLLPIVAAIITWSVRALLVQGVPLRLFGRRQD